MDAERDDELLVDGEWPNLAGHALEQLITEEYWHHGVIADTANVAWIKVAEQWHRLYFDLGMVFWRRSNDEPGTYTMPELHGEVRLADVGRIAQIVGDSIESIEGRAIPNGTEVVMRFQSGRTVTFRNTLDGDEDVTDYIVGQP